MRVGHALLAALALALASCSSALGPANTAAVRAADPLLAAYEQAGLEAARAGASAEDLDALDRRWAPVWAAYETLRQAELAGDAAAAERALCTLGAALPPEVPAADRQALLAALRPLCGGAP